MKTILIIPFLLLSCATHSAHDQNKPITKVLAIELKNYSFEADSFFDERKNLIYEEVVADAKFQEWGQDAINKVNKWVPQKDQLPLVKLKLIFNAYIKNKLGKIQIVPISMIESYQEPQTQSIRLGMLEQKIDKLTYQLTVAHEYAHLLFVHVSRKAVVVEQQASQINFWPKSVYEGVADYMMSIALESKTTAHPDNWSSRRLDEYESLEEARKTKSNTISKAKKAFKEYGLIPQYPIYQDWLKQIEAYVKSLGGFDPYAEGTWVTGSLLKHAKNDSQKRQIVETLLKKAKSGQKYNDPENFTDEVQKILR